MRWPAASDETRSAIERAQEQADEARAAARRELLQLVDGLVRERRVTVTAAAPLIGMTRAPLTRALAELGGEERPHGRGTPPDIETRERLIAAAAAHDERVAAIEREFNATVAGAIQRKEISVSEAARVLGVHRTTLIRTLDAAE